jgi:endogenous inhibitor of DNA gyrase (YacG/DUF329 family)
MSIAPKADKTGCPLCGKPASRTHRPFCGQGCRDRDLLNWLGDAYRMPGPSAGADADGGLDREADPPL